jgi:hypothetical protein
MLDQPSGYLCVNTIITTIDTVITEHILIGSNWDFTETNLSISTPYNTFKSQILLQFHPIINFQSIPL